MTSMTAGLPLPGPGDQVGPYDIEAELARGGMGVVFRARHRRLGQVFALKMLPADEADAAQAEARFHREGELLSRLRHPHIVGVHDIGVHRGRPYIAMEYIAGENLEAHWARGDLGLVHHLELLCQVAEAVDAAHEAGVMHRDLKPANILIDEQGQAHVVDFGLARLYHSSERLTREGALLGTPHYMAPEQVLGQVDRMGPAVDIYALGVLLYRLIAGTAPYQADTLPALCQQILHAAPRPPRALRPGLPMDLQSICLKAMEKDPELRYVSARALAKDLKAFLSFQPVTARPPGRLRRLRQWARRNRAYARSLALGLTAVAGLAVAFGATRWDRVRARDLKAQARQRRIQAELESGTQEAAAGRRHEALERWSRAVRAFPEAITLHGRSVALRLELGRDALAAGQVDIAAYLFRAAEAAGRAHEAAEGLAAVDAQRRRRTEAIDRTLRQVTEETAARVASGQVATEEDALDWTMRLMAVKGEDLVTAMLAAPPHLDLGRLVFARAFGHLADPRPVPLLLSWLRYGDHDAALRAAAAESLWRLGDPEARRVVMDTWEQEPQLEIWLDVLIGRLDWPEDADSDAADLERRGRWLHAQGRYADACQVYGRAVERDPTRAASWVGLGRGLNSQGAYPQALGQLDEALRREPGLSRAWLARGMALYRLGRQDEALLSYSRAIDVDPANAEGYIERGQLWATLGHMVEALTDLDRAIDLQPGLPLAYNVRAQLRHMIGALDAALEDCNQALRLFPRYGPAFNTRGGVYRAMGKLPEALADFTEGLRRMPENYVPRLNRAFTHADMGNWTLAMRDLEYALGRWPSETAIRSRAALLAEWRAKAASSE